ncbi:MAG: hypothetical protein QNL61_08680 [Crocinitomicaceae bacterium]
MLIIPVLMAVSFGLLISLVGLFALAKTKKDGHGKIYKITSYMTIIVGNVIVIGGIVAGSMLSCFHSSCGYGHVRVGCETEMSSYCLRVGKSCSKKSECKKSECKNGGESKYPKSIICTKDGNKEIAVKKEILIVE